jgi:site-specific DNA recombinase
MEKPKIRVVGYVRVSDESQVEGHSLDAQRREIKRYCDGQSYELVKTYADEGVSAYTDQIEVRPQFASLLTDADDRIFEIVIVHTIDRWARSSAVQAEALRRLGNAKIGFVSITENMDYTTHHGKWMLTMMGANSELSSALIGIHVKKAQRQRAESGLPLGDIPFGYVRDNSPKQAPVTVPSEADAILQVFEMRVQGESHGAIAAWINSKGFRTRTGRMFTEYSIRDMLSNRFYTGVVVYQGDEFPGRHQAIVPESLYQQVQLRRHKHGRRNNQGGVTGALQGMLACNSCGNAIHSERNHQGDPRYRERHGWPCESNGRSVIAHRIDPQIGEIIAGIKLPVGWRELILTTAISGGPAMDLAGLKRQKRRIAQAYGDGAYTDEDYRRRIDEIDAKIISNTPVLMPSIDEAGDLIDDLPGMWREALP